MHCLLDDTSNEIDLTTTCDARLLAFKMHENAFSQYKNYYEGKSVGLVATGPSLKHAKFINQIDLIGVNSCILSNNVNSKIKFFFAIDYMAVEPYIEKILDFPGIEKFYGYFLLSSKYTRMMIPESVAIRHKAHRFVATPLWNTDESRHFGFNPEISVAPLHAYASTIIPAFQFALYTNPSKLYLYGCDASNLGHFNGGKTISSDSLIALQREWEICKKMASIYYPETEIISVNPVGLKGLFKDVYTESFLVEHPEIGKESVILK